MKKKLYLGIDVGGTNIKSMVLDKDSNILSSSIYPTQQSKYSGLIEQICSIYNEYSEEYQGYIEGIGVLFPGFVNFREKLIEHSPNLKILKGKSIWDDLEQKFGNTRFIIENDANGAAYGEFWKRKQKDSSLSEMIMLTFGTGVGGGVISNSKILKGASGFAAELGHLSLGSENRKCGCGSVDCSETYLANDGIVKTYENIAAEQENREKNNLDAEQIAEMVKKGDKNAERAFTETAKKLGKLISLLINIFNPQIIVLGGGIMKSAGLLMDKALKTAEVLSIPVSFDNMIVELARMESDAGAFGAAVLARQEFAEL